jgi:hypothetical protein
MLMTLSLKKKIFDRDSMGLLTLLDDLAFGNIPALGDGPLLLAVVLYKSPILLLVPYLLALFDL